MRRMKFLFLAFLLCMLSLIGVGGIVSAQTRDDAQARAAFLEAFKVFSHARCVNCHPAGDAPLQHLMPEISITATCAPRSPRSAATEMCGPI